MGKSASTSLSWVEAFLFFATEEAPARDRTKFNRGGSDNRFSTKGDAVSPRARSPAQSFRHHPRRGACRRPCPPLPPTVHLPCKSPLRDVRGAKGGVRRRGEQHEVPFVQLQKGRHVEYAEEAPTVSGTRVLDATQPGASSSIGSSFPQFLLRRGRPRCKNHRCRRRFQSARRCRLAKFAAPPLPSPIHPRRPSLAIRFSTAPHNSAVGAETEPSFFIGCTSFAPFLPLDIMSSTENSPPRC